MGTANIITPIFEEATVYTALQFFHRHGDGDDEALPENLYVAAAPDGIMADNPWEEVSAELPWDNIELSNRWLLLGGGERALIDQLYDHCLRLDDQRLTTAIYQGLITSMDKVYHLRKIAPGRYISKASGDVEVVIEDAIMRPLVSGDEAKRYIEADTETYILFPYQQVGERMTLIPDDEMEAEFPLCWRYLKSHEVALRKREKGKFDGVDWHQFGRNQNLDKQDIVKLIVPRLVASLKAATDHGGSFYLDNADITGVAAIDGVDPYFLSAVLNGPVANFVFRRVSKPFRGDYLSAEKQYIDLLPVPLASAEEQQALATNASDLQRLHTLRRDRMASLRHRFENSPARLHPLTFLFPLFANADNRAEDEALAYTTIEEALHPDVLLDARFDDGELRLLADGAPLVSGIFLNKDEGPFIAAQWNGKCDAFKITSGKNAKRLVTDLRRLIETDNAALIAQVVALQEEIRNVTADIAALEAQTNEQLYALYQLTADERAMVEAG